MKNKKGFTLVELLAVIVVLAIILAVAIPSISSILKDSAKKTFGVDAKEILKAIDYKRIEYPNFNPLIITKENMNDQLGIDPSQYEQVIIQVENKNVSIVIIGADKWKGLIAYGTLKDMNVVESGEYDAIPPAITILGNNPANISRGSTYTDAGATATDIEDGNVPISLTVIRNASNQIVDTIDTSSFTTYTITYTAVDSKGNKATSIRIVNVVDKTAPIITILGDNPTTISVNSIYSDAGATATDETDGDITNKIVTTGTVNPSIIGTYSITYTVKDNAGNAAIPVTRTINVVDVLAPVITILGSNPTNVNVGSTYTDAGATAIDDVDGNVTGRIVVTGTVNPSVVGTYTITYTVKDNANNQAVATRTVYVVDNVPPTVAFGTNGNTTYAKSRSTTVTVSDNVAVNTSSLKYQWTTSTTSPTEASFSTTFTNGGIISTPAGLTGGYYLWILAKDTNNNTMIDRSNVFNLDNTVPTIAVNLNGYTVGTWATSNITITSSGTDVDSGIGSYQYSNDGGSTWTTIPSSWVINWDGQWSLAFRSTDNAGNISTLTSYYSVKRDATAPSIPTVNLNGYTSGTWTNQNITYNLSSTDSGSGVYKYQYSGTGGYDWVDLTPGTNSQTISWEINVGLIFRTIDNAGNASGVTSTYKFMRDKTAPVIKLSGSNPVTIGVGSTYTDAGATATDNLSGVSGSVQASSNVNPNVVGTYTVTYNVSDNAGNTAISVTRTVNVINTVYTYGYTGASQTFTAPLTGTYQIELWGASGGGAPTGNGAYTKGTVTLAANTVMYVYIGGAGTIGLANGVAQASSTDNPPTFNGGGGGARGGTYNYNYRQGNSGGGASDVRLTSGTWNDTTSLRSRIMVAAGGGAKGTVTLAGEAGGLNGNVVNSYDHGGELYYSATGGTQTAGGSRGYTNMGYYGNNGSFGIGANGGNYAVNHTYGAGGAGGGGGYYGGGSGVSSEYNVGSSSSGGGSSFISGHAGCNAINSSGTATGQPNHYSGYVFTATQMIDGAGYNWTTAKGSQVQMPNPSGGSYSLGVGNSGNGYAKITYIGS